MTIDSTSFVFIIALAGVINGLGIVRWLTSFAEYLKRRATGKISLYWIFVVSASFQFLLHIVFWWSLWGLRGSATIDFLAYAYLLCGPILMFVGTALLVPSDDDAGIDLEAHYRAVRPMYASTLAVTWAWAIFLSPILRGEFAPTLPLFLAFLANAIVMRLVPNATAQAGAAIVNWLLSAALIGLYFMQLGGWASAQ